MDADVSRAQVHGELHTLDENAIIGALEPMFGTCNKKQDLQFEADGFDVQIYESNEKFLLSAAVHNKTPQEAVALVRSLGNRLEAAKIPYSLEVEDDEGMWERFEWSPT